MRAIWKGAVAFGLVNVPVKLYSATGEHSVPLHQVHEADGGRIRYRKVCSVDGEEVPFAEIARGYETDDGHMVVLTDEDFEALPLATEREISVEEFVPVEQVDPIMLGKTYYLEPEKTAAKPYALLREALRTTDRMAVVKVALRQRESMAVLRVRGDVICLQTLLWPDEIREADFPILENDVTVRPQELTMAASLVESLAGDFDPSQFEDAYQGALEELIEMKVSTGRTVAAATPKDEDADQGGEVVDLLSALQRSVEKARRARGEDVEEDAPAPSRARSGTKAASTAATGGSGSAPRAAAVKAAGTKAPGAKVTGTRGAGTQAPATRATATKATGTKATATKATATKAAGTKAAGTKAAGTKAKAGPADEKAATPARRRRAS